MRTEIGSITNESSTSGSLMQKQNNYVILKQLQKHIVETGL